VADRPDGAHDLVIVFSPTRGRGWRAFVLQQPPHMPMNGFDQHGEAFGLAEPDLGELARRLRARHDAPVYRVRGASNGGMRLSFAANLAPVVREWLDDLLGDAGT
jgi:hypothetical protein